MSTPEPPKHRIEFTGSTPKKPRKPRKPPPKWLVNWFGGLLLFVVGAASGGFAAVALIWRMLTTTDDVGSPLGIILTLLMGAIAGTVAGCIVGLCIWAKLRSMARELAEFDE